MLIDSHCHLDFPELEADLDGVLARAKAAGIDAMVTISTRVKRFSGRLFTSRRRTPVTEQTDDANDPVLSWLEEDRLHEECGVFGIFNHPDAAALTALGLHGEMTKFR